MKAKIFTLSAVIGAFLLGGCATNSYVVDDVYYTPDVAPAVTTGTVVVTDANAAQPAEASGNDIFSSIDDYYRDNTYNQDTLKASGADLVAEDGGDVVINNYNDPTMSYASRIHHFYYPSVGFGYYDPFYDPFYYGSGLSFSMGIGIGFGYGYGYPMYGYMPPYYPYSPYMPYYPPYYSPGYGGCCCCAGVPYYPYYGDDYSQKGSTYGPRRSSASNRLVTPEGATPAKNALIPSTPAATTTVSGQVPATAVSSDAEASDPVSRRVSSGSSRATGSGTATTAVRSQRSGTATTASTRSRDVGSVKNATATTRVYQPRRSSGTATMQTTRLSGSSSTAARASTARSSGVTSTNRVRSTSGTRSYVPRYTNTRSTKASVRPSYNTSRSTTTTRSRSLSSSPVVKKSYSYPSRRSSYSTPRRSSSSSYSTPTKSYSHSSSSSYTPSRSTSSSSSRSSSGRRR
jgi:hypothetical protein